MGKKSIKLPKFTNDFYSSTIGSWIVCQHKLGNAPSNGIQRHDPESFVYLIR